MTLHTTRILRSPDPEDAGAAPSAADVDPQPGSTDNPGDAPAAQRGGASTDSTDTPEPSNPVAEVLDKVMTKKGDDDLTDEEIDRIAASLDDADAGEGAKVDDEANPEPEAEAGDEELDEEPPAKPVADKPKAPPAKKPAAEPKKNAESDDDLAHYIAEKFPKLADFEETHDLVKHVRDLERKLEAKDKSPDADTVVSRIEQMRQAERQAEMVHQAINEIPDLNTSKYGIHGRRMTRAQQEQRTQLDATAAKFYKQMAAESNIASLKGDERADEDYRLTTRALEAAHRFLERKTPARPKAEPARTAAARHASQTRSPAAMGAGRVTRDYSIKPTDSGSDAVAKVLLSHGIKPQNSR